MQAISWTGLYRRFHASRWAKNARLLRSLGLPDHGTHGQLAHRLADWFCDDWQEHEYRGWEPVWLY